MRRYSSPAFSVLRSFSWKMSSRRRRSFVHLEKSQAKVFTAPFPPVPIHPLDHHYSIAWRCSVMAITILGFFRKSRTRSGPLDGVTRNALLPLGLLKREAF